MGNHNPETLKQWRLKNKEKLLNRHRERNSRSPRYAFSSTLGQARKRAEVTIDQDYLMSLYDDQQGLCALSGVRMTWATGKTSPTSISMDRIDNQKGYVEGNVRLVCVCVNAFRGIMDDHDLLKMAKALVSTMEAKNATKQVLEEVCV